MPSETRCEWAAGSDELMLAYHDEEWGVPSHDDRHLFEMLTLEGAQAGLSWSTILRKREGYRQAFASFDPELVARFTETDVERLLADPGIVRNRLKVESTIVNAGRVLDVQAELGSLDAYCGRSSTAPRSSTRGGRVGATRGDRGVASSLERPEAARISLRRADGLLRVHAVMGMVDDHRRLLPYSGTAVSVDQVRAKSGTSTSPGSRAAESSTSYSSRFLLAPRIQCEHPELARFLLPARILLRLIRCDKRGTGLSDQCRAAISRPEWTASGRRGYGRVAGALFIYSRAGRCVLCSPRRIRAPRALVLSAPTRSLQRGLPVGSDVGAAQANARHGGHGAERRPVHHASTCHPAESAWFHRMLEASSASRCRDLI